VEPAQRQEDHPHRYAAGRDRRRVSAGVELIGDIDGSLARLLEAVLPTASAGGMPPRVTSRARSSSTPICGCSSSSELEAHRPRRVPDHPQRAIVDLRRALGPSDIVVSDVGAHKVWVARLYQAYEPNTVIISNGFAAMGIAVPGAIAAKSSTRIERSSRCVVTAAS
jgi:acetolactate synthase-1/2/3 large subunit